jgi:hypothetical protein
MSFVVLPNKYRALAPQMQEAIAKERDREGQTIKREFGITTRTWKRKPDFEVHVFPDGEMAAGTDNPIFGYVDEGTRPHIIRPRVAKALRFNTVFRAKTIPNQMTSREGVSSPPVAVRMEVHHPGTKPRNFTKLMAKRSGKRFPRNIAKAMKTIRSKR